MYKLTVDKKGNWKKLTTDRLHRKLLVLTIPLTVIAWVSCAVAHSRGARINLAGTEEEVAAPTPAVLLESPNGSCSGVAIQRLFVLTAAHCLTDHATVQPIAPLANRRAEIIGATKVKLPSKSNEDPALFEVEDFLIPSNSRFADSEFNNITRASFGESDIAVLKLRKSLPSEWPLATLSDFSPDFLKNTKEPLDALMFGTTERNLTDHGTLRHALMMISLRENQGEFYALAHPKMPQSGLCGGDSGGGLFMNSGEEGKFVVIGIASRTPATTSCKRSLGVFSDIHFFRDWIIKSMADLESTPQLQQVARKR